MNRIRKLIFGLGFVAIGTISMTSCDKYYYANDLQDIGSRVEYLESVVQKVNDDIAALDVVIREIEANGFVTKIDSVMGEDGTYVYNITFNDGRVVKLHDGKPGEDVSLNISARKDPVDGKWYWTLGDDWLYDKDGNRMQAGAVDGKNGKTADEVGAVVPLVRVNPVSNHWEISTDNGVHWTDTGVSAIGKNGERGDKDIIEDVKLSDDGKYLTFFIKDKPDGSVVAYVVAIEW